MTTSWTNPRALWACLALLAAISVSREAPAQTASSGPRAAPAPGPAVVLFPVALYNAQANVQEASDSSQAAISTQVLAHKLRELLGDQIIAGRRVAAVASSSSAQATSGGQPCNVIVACAREVADSLEAPWVVMAKVSKTSNLIWLFTGQLIHVPTGEIILDDSTELKGEPAVMVRAGSRIFAERVARTVRNGGVANDFPNNPEWSSSSVAPPAHRLYSGRVRGAE
ncbi:MAG: DUF2380 domain-containing protein [Gemmatimonadales bacterium]